MELVQPGTYIDFMRHRRPVVGASVFLVLLSLASVFWPGPRYGTDFAGGTELQVLFGGDITPAELRTTLEQMGHSRPDVVTVEDSDREYIIRVREVSTVTDAQRTSIEHGLREALHGVMAPCPREPGAPEPEGEPEMCPLDLSCAEGTQCIKVSPGGDKMSFQLTGPIEIPHLRDLLIASGAHIREGEGTVAVFGRASDNQYEAQLIGVADDIVSKLGERLGDRGPTETRRVEWVGPKAGQRLRDAAIQALLYAIAFIMVYVAFRFDLRFAPGGVIALFHDVLITFGIYVLVQKEVNLTTVAALLTILGYSINDTIVVYDRIRENMGRLRDTPLFELINISTSQMLSRTIVTSGTTLLSMSAFFIWGTPVIKDIAFALFIGILVGTYSSVYVAAPVTEWMDRRFFSRKR